MLQKLNVPRILSNIFPHCKEHCCRYEAVLDDEGEEVGPGVLDNVTHDEVTATGEVVGQVNHPLTVKVRIGTCFILENKIKVLLGGSKINRILCKNTF